MYKDPEESMWTLSRRLCVPVWRNWRPFQNGLWKRTNMLIESQFCNSVTLKASVVCIFCTEDNYSSLFHLTAVISLFANLTVIIGRKKRLAYNFQVSFCQSIHMTHRLDQNYIPWNTFTCLFPLNNIWQICSFSI